MALGMALVKSDRLSEAMEAYEAGLDIATDLPELYFAQGRLYGKTGRWDEALKAFTNALDIEPEDPQLLYDAACASSRLEHLSEALDYLERITLGDGPLAKAEADEDLRFIREHPESASRFRALLEGHVHGSS
jgi:tetratricopeptide (TPR) repeat protein